MLGWCWGCKDFVSVTSTNRCTQCKQTRSYNMNGKKARKIRRDFRRKMAASGLGMESVKFNDGQIVVKKRWLYQKHKAQSK